MTDTDTPMSRTEAIGGCVLIVLFLLLVLFL